MNHPNYLPLANIISLSSAIQEMTSVPLDQCTYVVNAGDRRQLIAKATLLLAEIKKLQGRGAG